MIFRSFITDFLPICNGVSRIQKMLERKLEIKGTDHEPRIWGLNKFIARKLTILRLQMLFCLFFSCQIDSIFLLYFVSILCSPLPFISILPFSLWSISPLLYSGFRSTALVTNEQGTSLLSRPVAEDVSEPSGKTKGSCTQFMG